MDPRMHECTNAHEMHEITAEIAELAQRNEALRSQRSLR